MEKYREIKKLGKGSQASCYLVEHLKEKKEYVLKKIECEDENGARKAFQEAMALSELKHPNVCGYKEFFVNWDKIASAMFVCIIMENYPNGDLSRIIKQRRSKKKLVETQLFRKWVAQMLEALVYIHQKNIIHRDLKPSNIFLRTDLSLSIGDFGVATLMDDKRTKTRTTVGSVNWMAPEVFERPYDERSDVWSFGCIVLELATCSILDQSQINDVLFEMKQDSEQLESTLALIGKLYSPSVTIFIRKCLARNFHQRPAISELCKLEFAKDALRLIGSSLVDQEESLDKTKVEPPKKGWSTEKIGRYIEQHPKNSFVVTESLQLLNDRQKEELEKCRKAILIAMSSCKENPDIVLLSYKLVNKAGITTDLVRPLLSSMRACSNSIQVQREACYMLSKMGSEKVSAKLGEHGAMQDVISLLRINSQDELTLVAATKALWCLSVNELNAAIATAEKALKELFTIMERFPRNEDLTEHCISGIWSLCLEDDNEDMVIDVGIGLILQAITAHSKSSKILRAALMALTAIASCGDSACFRIIDCETEAPGCDIIVQAVEHHINIKEVCEEFALFVEEMLMEDDIKAELQKQKKNPIYIMMKKIKSKHKNLTNVAHILNKF